MVVGEPMGEPPVSLEGASVVDYCIVHNDDLQKICIFRVTRAREVFVWVISTLNSQFLIIHYCHGSTFLPIPVGIDTGPLESLNC